MTASELIPRKKKKLLILSYRYPYPSYGGDKLRIHNIAKKMSSEYSITLLCLTDDKNSNPCPPDDPEIYDEIKCIYHPRWKSYLNCLSALFTETPLQVADYRSEEFREALSNALESVDVAIAHLVRTGDYLRGRSLPRVLEMTDAISMNYERVKKSKNRSLKALIYGVEAKRLAHYERQMAAEFDLVSLVSAVDAGYLFGTNLPDNVVVTPLTLDIDKIAYCYNPNKKSISFIGNLRTLPNLDAVRWFAHSVMPILLGYGDYEFNIIGLVDEHEKKELERLNGVRVRGTVQSLSEAVNGAFVGVCPMRVGAGIQTKVLEYMALGLPVVSSPLGAEGIEAKENKDILIARDEDEFAENIVKLANDDQLARSISLSARSYLESFHSTSTAMAGILSRVTSIMDRGSIR